MEPVALQIAADLAASFLVMLLFVIELVAIVVLFGMWRGLKLARQKLPEFLHAADDGLQRVEDRTRETTDAVVRPQIALASRLAGLKAGARALIARRT